MTRRILVTAALPYASGQIHLGNLLEMVQTDIWVRYQRLSGADCAFVCATDAHGTPTMLKAREENVSPEEYAESCRAAHARDFESFGIRFDNYYTTHSPENRALVERIYSRLVERGFIRTRTIQQGGPTTKRRACSCPTATCAASVPPAARRTSTATVAQSAGPPTRRRNWSIPVPS